MEKAGHHWGGMAVSCVWVLKADETNHKKGARENPTVRRVAARNRGFLNNPVFMPVPPSNVGLLSSNI
jgi:hypothetical protein